MSQLMTHITPTPLPLYPPTLDTTVITSCIDGEEEYYFPVFKQSILLFLTNTVTLTCILVVVMFYASMYGTPTYSHFEDFI